MIAGSTRPNASMALGPGGWGSFRLIVSDVARDVVPKRHTRPKDVRTHPCSTLTESEQRGCKTSEGNRVAIVPTDTSHVN